MDVWPRLEVGAVQVWHYRLGEPDELLARAHATLSPEERERGIAAAGDRVDAGEVRWEHDRPASSEGGLAG